MLLTVERQMEGREEIVMGNACERKLGSLRSKAILLSHAWGVEPSPKPFFPQASNSS